MVWGLLEEDTLLKSARNVMKAVYREGGRESLRERERERASEVGREGGNDILEMGLLYIVTT